MKKEQKDTILLLGPNKIRVETEPESGRTHYYNEHGTEISETVIHRLVAWLKNAPVNTEFLRKTPVSAETEFKDNEIRGVMDCEFSRKEYQAAYETLCDYCQMNPVDLTIKISSYVKCDNGYDAVSFLFEGRGEKTHTYKASYGSNDYTQEPTILTKSNYEEFETFCKEKFDTDYVFIPNSNDNGGKV